MAIYSFNHDTFGKTTNRAGAAGENAAYNADFSKTELEVLHQATREQWEATGRRVDDAAFDELLAGAYGRSAAANIAYNARTEATYAVHSHVIPAEPNAAQAWFRDQEARDRKNARMSDRFIAALPRELTPEQCIEAVQGFCRQVTGDRIPWHFALHLELDKKNDADWNPHTHIIFRDRDIESGRRVLYTSAGPKERRQLDAKGIEYWTTKDFRVEWNDHLNRALERAGHDARVDHRTLREQGIAREAGIHVGPGNQSAVGKGHDFESRDIQIGVRTIPYSVTDEGTRADHAARIKSANDSPQLQPTTPRGLAVQRDQERLRAGQKEVRSEQRTEQAHDRDALREAHKAEIKMHRVWAKSFADAERKTATPSPQAVRAITTAAWQSMQALHAQDRKDLGEAHVLESAAQFRAHASERLAVSARASAETLQSATNQIAGQPRGGMAAQQKTAVQQMHAHHAAGRSPLERVRELTQTANSEHNRADELRGKLTAQRQTNRLIATEPEAQAGRAIAALHRLTEAAEHAPVQKDASRGPRTTPFTVLDAGTRAQHAAAEQSWQTQAAIPGGGRQPMKRPLARAQTDERKQQSADQALDRAALRDAHTTEQQVHAAWAKTLTADARKAASGQVREAMSPKWQAVRALPGKAQRAEAAKTVTAESRALYAATARKALAGVRGATESARASMLAVHALDRKGLSQAHGLETAALSRVHATERLAVHSNSPAIVATAGSQRELVKGLRTKLTAHRQTCRFVAAGSSVSPGHAERAISALRRVVADDHQKEQQSSAVARGGGTDADRASASPQARDGADRARHADRQRKGDAGNASSSSAGNGRKGGGRGR